MAVSPGGASSDHSFLPFAPVRPCAHFVWLIVPPMVAWGLGGCDVGTISVVGGVPRS